jgi:hypothetical protein
MNPIVAKETLRRSRGRIDRYGGDGDGKTCAFAGGALHPDIAAVGMRHGLNQAQAQAGAR